MRPTRIPLPYMKAVLRQQAANLRPRKYPTLPAVGVAYVHAYSGPMVIIISPAVIGRCRCRP